MRLSRFHTWGAFDSARALFWHYRCSCCWNSGSCCRNCCCCCRNTCCSGGDGSGKGCKRWQDSSIQRLRWTLRWLQRALCWKSNLTNWSLCWSDWPRWPLTWDNWPCWPLCWPLDKLDLIEAWVVSLQLVREDLAVLGWQVPLGLALVAQHLEAQLALLLHTLVLQELVEAAAAQLLPVFEEAERAEVARFTRVDRTS